MRIRRRSAPEAGHRGTLIPEEPWVWRHADREGKFKVGQAARGAGGSRQQPRRVAAAPGLREPTGDGKGHQASPAGGPSGRGQGEAHREPAPARTSGLPRPVDAAKKLTPYLESPDF